MVANSAPRPKISSEQIDVSDFFNRGASQFCQIPALQFMKISQAFAAAAAGLIFSVGPCAHAQDEAVSRISLEDLLATEVTSVAKKPQRVEDAAAAVFVIGQEDIRRSSETRIPELLRMAPGVEVGDLAGGGAAVSVRGFNGLSANKLLVLVDGREIYIPSLSGVFWDQQLLPVEDIQRIEVVRGPGATLWGGNAVNGVINIVSKHAVDTLGAFASAQAATDGSYRIDARYGVQIGQTGAARVYVNEVRIDDPVRVDGLEIRDHSRAAQGGFRIDMEPTAVDAVTLQGDADSGVRRYPSAFSISPGPVPLPSGATFSGADVLGRWTRTWNDRSALSLQVYWDRVHRVESSVAGNSDHFDVELSHHFDLGQRHAVIWGLQYRNISDEIAPGAFLRMTPPRVRQNWYGGYLQDDISLADEQVRLSIGAKFDHNDVTGFEFQPSARAIWRSPWNWAMWAAVSRAVRTPSRYETGLTITTPLIELLPNNLKAETLTAYELGWRGQIGARAALDVATYHMVYRDLLAEALTGTAGPAGPFDFQLGNRTGGRNNGVEAALDVQVTPDWVLKAAGSWQNLAVTPVRGYVNLTGLPTDPGASPKVQLSLRSQWNLGDSVDADLWYRHVGRLRSGPVPPYDALDLRLAWRPGPHLELSLTGQSLLQHERIDIALPLLPFREQEVERRLLVSMSARY